jgi:pyrroline-5-carboxylate reductase
MKIAFVGAGKMAEAIIARLQDKKNVWASDVSRERLTTLRSKYKIKILENNGAAFATAEVIILAVKPQQMAEVLQGVGSRGIGSRGKNKLIISIAAGIPLKYLQKMLPNCAVIRAMPNNPALIGQGMTALAKGARITNYELRITKKIFASVGEVVEVPERLMDAVTGLSGSGPAYVYRLIEALTDGGVKAGLPKKIAAKLAVQTVYGAAATVKETGREPQELRLMVTSPGGTTLEGLKALERRHFAAAVIEAVGAAAKKSRLLSKH